jgi:uncharacterized protein YdbL (DUF1318 family)
MKTTMPVRIFPVLAILSAVACSIKPPEVKVTGEKTALEREIIGTYHQMREDTWMVASTRSTDERQPVVMSAEKKKVLEALQQQEFNKDDVEEFKKKGYVGESGDGSLVVRGGDDLKRDAEQSNLVRDIVQEENQCRQAVLQRVVELNDALKKAVPKDVLSVFAKMYQDNSPKGTWIQKPAGDWVRKE